MPRPYRPIAFANEFIVKSPDIGVSHMKLQKLTYYAYGWWLALKDDPVLTEGPEVWAHGPVFWTMYHALKGFGGTGIKHPQKDHPFQDPPRIDDGDTEVKALLDWTWEKYGLFSPFYLSDQTHKTGSPWQQVAQSHDYRIPQHTTIPDEIIKSYFKGMAERSET